jgi:hypothetical protein
MLDFLIIQHFSTGVNLVEYKQESTKMKSEHSDILSRFLTAIQNIKQELDIETIVLISTKGTDGHNCIIIPRIPINVILLVDQEDSIDFWREQGKLIAKKFIDMYGENFNPNVINNFKDFTAIIKDITVNEMSELPDKDLELAKIELYSEHMHSRYMTMLPSMIAIYLAFVIAFWTFYFEGVLSIEGFFIALIVFSIPNFLGFYRFIRKFKRNMIKISDNLEKVKNGDPLPKLANM